MCQGYTPSSVSRGDSFPPCLFQLLVVQAFLGLWLHNSNLCLCLHRILSSLVSLISIPVTGFRAHLDKPGWFHFEILNYICKDPFPNNVTFTGSWGQDMDLFLEGPPFYAQLSPFQFSHSAAAFLICSFSVVYSSLPHRNTSHFFSIFLQNCKTLPWYIFIPGNVKPYDSSHKLVFL